MDLLRPTRRELIGAAPLLLAPAALPARARVLPRSAGKLRFQVLGDWGRDGAHWQRRVADLMAADARRNGCDFVVSTGDNFYQTGVTSTHDPQWRTSYEAIYAADLRRRPWFAVAGNHDWGGNVFAQLDRTGTGCWHMPWLWHDLRASFCGRPDVHLFFIDTVTWIGDESAVMRACGQAVRIADIRRQKQWLEQALMASDAPIKLVFGHHPIYSIGKYGGAKRLKDLDAMLLRGGASAYVCGHDHCLYHITAGPMHYVCSGGGSEELAKFSGDPDVWGCVLEGKCSEARWHSYVPRAGFALFDTDEQIHFRLVDRENVSTQAQTIAPRGKPPPAGATPPPDPATLPEHRKARAPLGIDCKSFSKPPGA